MTSPCHVCITLRTFLIAVGFLAFVTGLTMFFKLAIDDTSGKDRPVVTAELEQSGGGLVLSASASAAGLRSDEHVEILVQGLNSRTQLSDVVAGAGPRQRDDVFLFRDPSTEFDSPQRLHLSRVGGDREGVVAASLRLPISVGVYERVRIVATVTSKGGEEEEEARRREDQNEKAEKEELLAELLDGFEDETKSAQETIVHFARGSNGVGMVSAAQVLFAAADPADGSEASAFDLSEDEAVQLWNFEVTEALRTASEHTQHALTKALTDELGSGELRSGVRGELEYLLCLTREPENISTCEAPEHDPGVECSVFDRPEQPSGEDLLHSLEALGEDCLSDYENIHELATSWKSALDDFSNRDALHLEERDPELEERDPVAVLGELEKLLEAVKIAGRIGELERELTFSFEEDLKRAQDCNEEVLSTGCVTLLLPETQLRPTVGISVAGDSPIRAVDVTVKAAEIGDGDLVVVVVAAGADPSQAQVIMTTVMGSDGAGSVDETFRIPIDPEDSYTCAVSAIERGPLRPTKLIVEMPGVRVAQSSAPVSVATVVSGLSDMSGDSVCLSPPQTGAFTEIVIPLTGAR